VCMSWNIKEIIKATCTVQQCKCSLVTIYGELVTKFNELNLYVFLGWNTWSSTLFHSTVQIPKNRLCYIRKFLLIVIRHKFFRRTKFCFFSHFNTKYWDLWPEYKNIALPNVQDCPTWGWHLITHAQKLWNTPELRLFTPLLH